MAINEIILIPGAGHAGSGIYERGHQVDAFAEVDLVDVYARTMIEELDNSLIRYRVINTRKAPGTPHDQRYSQVFPNCFPIMLKMGWCGFKKALHNASFISAHKDVPKALVEELAEALRHWGGLYVHGHRCLEPTEQKEPGITMAPFQINGHRAADYSRHLDKLGRDIGVILVDFCRARGEGAAIPFRSGGFARSQPRG